VAVAVAASPRTHARGCAGPPAAPEPSGAGRRATVSGSQVTAYCRNPCPGTDRVGPHIECDRWWNLDSDASPVAGRPARAVRTTGRFRKEVRSVRVTCRRAK
ncbi:hypothetical protein ACIQMV_35000, partial [Streptomyces sp. NPDC091412]|uniref:hypothetical protein n=1 Tax=Streptomyces sp. NPDC091412 TaxID=3366002 RepID=UPI00382EB99A